MHQDSKVIKRVKRWVRRSMKKAKEHIREMVPDIPMIRKKITKKRIAAISAVTLPMDMVHIAEADPSMKASIVNTCAEKWPKIYSLTEKSIERIFDKAIVYQDASEEAKSVIRTDMLFCRFAYGFIPAEYVTYNLERLSMDERNSFISERDHICFSFMMNDVFEWQLFNDKMKTYQRFDKYYGRDIISVERADDYSRFESFIQNHPVFVKKDVYESCGNGIEKIDVHEQEKSVRELFSSFVNGGKTIIEECVAQGAETEVFNSSSVNTVRCITFRTKHGVVAPYCFMKIGRKGSFVDNGGAGGILVGIDEKTGVLNTNGIDEMRNVYTVHPDSGVCFVGHQLPKWDEMINMCIEMSSQISKVKYIGWDLAYTKDQKWVVIEGNGLSQFIGPQSVMQRGIKAEVKSLMRDMELMV